ncbi:MAG TPA: polyphosphate kinase 2 family protein [Chitinophagales bacterium]|nr:polyphosphate kinase 2 family protein [Chitinophagales bacterium]
MLTLEDLDVRDFLVKPGQKISLKDFPTDLDNKKVSKEEGETMLQQGIEKLAIMQDKLYAFSGYSVLIVLQAMDAAGKDSTIKHIMSGLNPTGVKVVSFKTPSVGELKHDYFWRHYKELPARGEICIFNRSYYENVLITRVHPELILHENLHGINNVKDIDKDFWKMRYKQIRRFEKNISENGTIILKFYLHVSKDEQKKRFLERIDNAKKNWKLSLDDLKERACWKAYEEAFEDALNGTSTENAPWFVIPADDKWFLRLIIAGVIYKQLDELKLEYPKVSKEQKAELMKAKESLLSEKE